MKHKEQNKIDEALIRLEKGRSQPLPDLVTRIRNDLPGKPPRLRWFVDRWRNPALATLAAVVVFTMVLTLLVWRNGSATHEHVPMVEVHFELHAPQATSVELLGNFNNWQIGTLQLVGPDASGHWTTSVHLSEGRYEYLFLVDGKHWITDPKALVMRPDGFGSMNSILEVSQEGTVL